MKKLLVAIFAIVYITSFTGVNIHMHYCMGKLADWGLGDKNSNICSNCGMDMKDKKDNGCCKDKHQFLKNSTDQKTTETAFHFSQSIVALVPASYFALPSNNFTSVTEEKPVSNAPPRNHGVSVCILNCIYRI